MPSGYGSKEARRQRAFGRAIDSIKDKILGFFKRTQMRNTTMRNTTSNASVEVRPAGLARKIGFVPHIDCALAQGASPPEVIRDSPEIGFVFQGKLSILTMGHRPKRPRKKGFS